MPDMKNQEGRLATVEAEVKNIGKNVDDIKNYIGKLFESQSEQTATLAVIKSKQDDALNYQKTCDAERRAHENRLGDNEDDIIKLKSFQKTEKTIFGAIGSMIGIALTFIGEFIRK